MVVDVISKLGDNKLREWMICPPHSLFFPKIKLAGNTVSKICLNEHGLVFFADPEDLVISSKVVNHHGSDKSIHRRYD